MPQYSVIDLRFYSAIYLYSFAAIDLRLNNQESSLAQPHQKLADSLNRLKELQADGRCVFRSGEFTRTHRERLVSHGFLLEVMKGWVISISPGEQEGDSTPWYASFWEFCARYCQERFGTQWHLSPEQSLLLTAGHTVIPRQLVIYSPRGTNNSVDLLFDTSLYDLKQKAMAPRKDLEEVDGLRLYRPAVALIKVPESFYRSHPVEAQVVLSQISEASELLAHLLAGGHSSVAGRLAGALRRIGRVNVADEIVTAMNSADYTIREADPFDSNRSIPEIVASTPPIVARLRTLWETHRSVVLDQFPDKPGLPADAGEYLDRIDEIYRSDAYHSLSIEGYRVTPELVERVKSGDWNPDSRDVDRNDRDALAARGYWQAFKRVKDDVAEVLAGAEPGQRVRRTHQDWYRELFQPCVAAGLIGADALAGYRNDAVYLRGSRYVPPRPEVVRHAMPALFDLLAEEDKAAVKAVLGHWLLGYIHPYPDGNGRMARFLMNVMLASGGFPWTVVRVEDRDAYLTVLEEASMESNILPFSKFIAERVYWSVDQVGE